MKDLLLPLLHPRGLLQYGGMSPKTLAGFLLWRKWIFDIDNRAGQETGYLFEPIICRGCWRRTGEREEEPHQATEGQQEGEAGGLSQRKTSVRDQAQDDDRSLWPRPLGRGA